jgi:hypothetical protein
MSTKNHNILYFVVISGIKLLNKGICLWKAPKPLAGRGFPPAKFALKPVHPPGSVTAPAQNPSLVLAGAVGKTQKWCILAVWLCELWRLGRIYAEEVSWDE